MPARRRRARRRSASRSRRRPRRERGRRAPAGRRGRERARRTLRRPARSSSPSGKAAGAPAGGSSSRTRSSIQTDPRPPLALTIVISIDPSSRRPGPAPAGPQAKDTCRLRTVSVVQSVGNVKSRRTDHQTFSPLGSSSLNSSVCGGLSARRRKRIAQLSGSAIGNGLRAAAQPARPWKSKSIRSAPASGSQRHAHAFRGRRRSSRRSRRRRHRGPVRAGVPEEAASRRMPAAAAARRLTP